MKKLFTYIYQHHIAVIVLMVLVSFIFAWVYGGRIADPQSFMFYNEYDGLKNYFTLCAYVLDEDASQRFLMSSMNFPYGEYIVYTDNTPLLAVIIKYCFSPDSPQEVIAIFNMMIISLLYLGHLVCYYLSRSVGIAAWPSVFASLVIPVMIPMIYKLSGHFNLALPISLFLPLLLSIHITKNKGVQVFDKGLYKVFLLILTVVLLFYVHVYLFAFAVLMVGVFLLHSILEHILISRDFRTIAHFSLAFVISIILVLWSIYVIDPWMGERPSGNNGYAIPDYTVKISDLFTSIDAMYIRALVDTVSWSSEDYAYMGAIFPLAIILVICSLSFGYSRMKKTLVQNRLILVLISLGLLCFFISLGKNIKTHDGTSGIANVLNVFTLLTEISDSFRNFRCVNRFFWITSLIFHLLFIKFIFSDSFKIIFGKKAIIVMSVLICIYCVDAYSIYRYQKIDYRHSNVFSEVELESYKYRDAMCYQAFIPLPYFSVGSESNLEYTIDAREVWSSYCMKFSLANDIPMMSGLLSRTPVRITKNLQTILNPPIDDQVLTKLDTQSILILKDLNFVYLNIQSPTMQKLADRTYDFVENNGAHIEMLDTLESSTIYELHNSYFRNK